MSYLGPEAAAWAKVQWQLGRVIPKLRHCPGGGSETVTRPLPLSSGKFASGKRQTLPKGPRHCSHSTRLSSQAMSGFGRGTIRPVVGPRGNVGSALWVDATLGFQEERKSRGRGDVSAEQAYPVVAETPSCTVLGHDRRNQGRDWGMKSRETFSSLKGLSGFAGRFGPPGTRGNGNCSAEDCDADQPSRLTTVRA